MIILYIRKNVFKSLAKMIFVLGFIFILSILFFDISFKLFREIKTLSKASYNSIELYNQEGFTKDTFRFYNTDLLIYKEYDTLNELYITPISTIAIQKLLIPYTQISSSLYQKQIPIDTVVISRNLAESYNLNIGDSIHLKGLTGNQDFRVYDIIDYHYGLFEIDVYQNKGLIIFSNQDLDTNPSLKFITLLDSDIREHSGELFKLNNEMLKLKSILGITIAIYTIIIILFLMASTTSLYRDSLRDYNILNRNAIQITELGVLIMLITITRVLVPYGILTYMFITLLGIEKYYEAFNTSLLLITLSTLISSTIFLKVVTK